MKKCFRGSATIEMAYLMPLVFLVFTVVIYTAFYYHDKHILYGAAYETAVTGSEKLREKDGCTAMELQNFFSQRMKGKLILFAGARADVQITEKEIITTVQAVKKGMNITLKVKGKVTRPEKYIRDCRRLKAVTEKVSEEIK